MDLGIKTLAQLSEEAKEKQYITLEVGSKISGYTTEYLERLCRLNKIEYLLGTNGQFIVELESLLRETHTILLSYDDITFVDKKELIESTNAPTTPPPYEGVVLEGVMKSAIDQTTLSAIEDRKERFVSRTPGTSPFSYVGRAVVSDSVQAIDAKDSEMNIPISLGAVPRQVKEDGVTLATSISEEIPESSRVVSSTETIKNAIENVPIINPTVVVPATNVTVAGPVEKSVTAQRANSPLEEAIASTPVVLPITELPQVLPSAILADDVTVEKSDPVVVEEASFPSPVTSLAQSYEHFVSEIPLYTVPHKPSQNLSVPRKQASPLLKQGETDSWDSTLLSSREQISTTVGVDQHGTPVSPELLQPISSPYHPIKTSVDPTVHHESLPLFPLVGKGVVPPAQAVKVTPQSAKSEMYPGIPDLGTDRRVIVYTPKKFSKKTDTSVKTEEEKPLIVAPLTMNFVGTIATAPVVTDVLVPEMEKNIMRKTANIPAIKVMPEVLMRVTASLPSTQEDHHLTLREKYPLIKSKGLNLAFAVFFMGTAIVLLGGVGGDRLLMGNSVSYVAGVGVALEPQEKGVIVPEEKPQAQPLSAVLPFSDEIVVVPGSQGGSILIQPVFKHVTGGAYEYTITSHRTGTTTSNAK